MKDIDKLIRLQEIDSEVFRIKTQLKELPQQIAEIDESIDLAAAGLRDLGDQLTQAQLKHKELELDLQDKEQQVVKQQGQLYQVKSNKEYSAFQLEIEKHKADNSLLEEQIIKKLDQIDTLKSSIAEEKQRVTTQTAQHKISRQELELKESELKQELSRLEIQRAEALKAGIEPELISQYERIIQHWGELAIVEVIDDICQGCSIKVRPQIVSQLQLGKLAACDSCARMLYVKIGSE